MEIKTFPFIFHSLTGTWRSPELELQLIQKARQDGPILEMFAPVEYHDLNAFAVLPNSASTVLVYQLRWLQREFDGIQPELRVLSPIDFGRRKIAGWYDSRLDFLYASLGEKTIIPEEIL